MKKSNNSMIFGVAAGASEHFGVKNPIWFRLIFLFGGAALFWLYIALNFLMDDPSNEVNL